MGQISIYTHSKFPHILRCKRTVIIHFTIDECLCMHEQLSFGKHDLLTGVEIRF